MRTNQFIITMLGMACLVSGCATAPSMVPRVTTAEAAVLSAATPASTAIAIQSAPVIDAGSVAHTVEHGETLFRIASTYGISIGELQAANPGVRARTLRADDVLEIPGAGQEQRIEPFLPTAHQWRYIIVHHSATEVGRAVQFDSAHRRRGFWNGLGYHFVVTNGSNSTRDGGIETGHRWLKQMSGAHCRAGGMNNQGIGVCLVGNFDHDQPTTAQMQSLAWLVARLQQTYNIPDSRVLGHHDVRGSSTHCPGLKFPWSRFKKHLARL